MLQEIIPIKLNGTFLVIGKIQSILLKDELLLPDGYINLQTAETVCSNGLDGYYSTNTLGRYNYAKPGQNPTLKFTDA
jgi:hypothetical protein